jgi:LEA14-like dessication related protein
MTRFVLVAAASAAVLAGAGCSSLGKQAFKEPVVELRDVKVTGVGLNGGSLDVVLEVQNPNGFTLDATRLTYKVLVDSVTFANGATDSRFTVQGNKSTQVHLPITFTYSGVGQAGRQLLGTGSVNYTVTGDVTVGSPIGNFTVPYSRTSRFSTLGGNSR